MANRTKRTPEKVAAFLDQLGKGASVTKACVAIGIGRQTAYEWREDDEAFKAEWDAAVEQGTDLLEDEALRRAKDGVTKPIYQSKELVGHVQEYSDTLMIFLLKARRPEKFKERQATELTGANGAALIPVLNVTIGKP